MPQTANPPRGERGQKADVKETVMEILSKGVLPEEQTYETTCSKCGTRFRFQQKEGRVVFDQRDGNAVVINCPGCQKETWIALKGRSSQQER